MSIVSKAFQNVSELSAKMAKATENKTLKESLEELRQGSVAIGARFKKAKDEVEGEIKDETRQKSISTAKETINKLSSKSGMVIGKGLRIFKGFAEGVNEGLKD